jgi:hypothetical protein
MTIYVKKKNRIRVRKSSGLLEPLSNSKLTRSLIRCGTPKDRAKEITDKVLSGAFDEMSTDELRKQVLVRLKNTNPVSATRYDLSRAVMGLGPTGFPFEKLIGRLYESEGYAVEINQTRSGRCVDHEIDVVAKRLGKTTFIECKFHNSPGFFVELKTTLYIKARSDDLLNSKKAASDHSTFALITNTRFSSESVKFGNCSGIELIAWSHPEGANSLVHRLERSGLIPLTALTSLPKRLASGLMNDGIITIRDWVESPRAWRVLPRNGKILAAIHSEIDELFELSSS